MVAAMGIIFTAHPDIVLLIFLEPLIQEGGIFSTFNQKDGIVSFVVDPEEYETYLMILDFDSSIQSDREACSSSAAFSMEQASVVVVPVARFINSCDMEQIRMAREKFTSLCRRFVDCVVQLETPLRGAASILIAIRNIQSSLKLLTCLHMEFLVLSLSSTCYKAGLSILDEYIFNVDQQKDPFLYCSYRGMICIGQKRFGKALELLHNFFASLPIYTSSVAQRNLKNYFQGNTLGLVKPASCMYGKGKTVIAFIGEHGIFVAGDGRIIHDNGHIVDGKGKKLFFLGSNICFAFAGSIFWPSQMLKKAKGPIKDFGSERKLYIAKVACEKLIRSWMTKKKNKNKEFPTTVLLCGYIRGKPHIFIIGPPSECACSSEVGFIKGIGSGLQWAEDSVIAELAQRGNLGKDESVQRLIRDVTVASLHSGGSGGRVRPAIVTPDVVEFPNPIHHVLHHLSTDYSRLEGYLGNKLFMLSTSKDYTLAGEMRIRDLLVKTYVGVTRIHILGINGRQY